MKHLAILFFCFFSCTAYVTAQIASQDDYLGRIKLELDKKWPENKTINIVFHGHSVPSGYFNTPNVCTLQAYPYQVLKMLKEIYPHAVVNTITTAIGGENAEQGNKRFINEVLTHHPDVLLIDYALNDRAIGLDRAKPAWESMINEALKRNIKVLVCTSTPDLTENILDVNTVLEAHARQIRSLAEKYKIGLIDSYAAFKKMKENGYELKDYMSQSNHPNEKGHLVVKSLIIKWFAGSAKLNSLKKSQTENMMCKVAGWQMDFFEAQVAKGSQWTNSHAYWAWTNATMYIGLAEWAKLSKDQKYWDFLYSIGEKNKWQAGANIYFSDDICIVQAYDQIYRHYKDEKIIKSSVYALDSIIANPKNHSLNYYATGSHSRWCWCDALFMAPPAFARLGKTTGKKEYFDFLDKEFWITYDTLYCPQEKLFFRDTRFKEMKEENGKKVFWGRGNGWVIGGLTFIIDNLPEDYPSRSEYIGLYKKMMERIAGLQDSRGFWHPSMLDTKSYPMPETSASGFFTYGLLWGVNHGYLDREIYLPVAIKAWDALCSAVQENGKLGYVQAIGADPKKVGADDTEVYGVGAFLLAGCEMIKLLEKEN